MKPAWSIILFTTLAGVAQGLAVALALGMLTGIAPAGRAMSVALWAVPLLLIGALIASFFHLGHPKRAWRAALMWRTSWMSREVIVLPAFIFICAAWAAASHFGDAQGVFAHILPWLAVTGAFVLWYCTAMIYACIRFIQEWAHPLTLVNYVLFGLSSGFAAACGLAQVFGETSLAIDTGICAAVLTATTWVTRSLSLGRNVRLRPISTIQSATGLNASRVVQKSMGMTGGSFNTREFSHGASLRFFRHMKLFFLTFAFGLPIAALALGIVAGTATAFFWAFPLQFFGILGERWYFFAEARHPQNIYYQVIS